MYTKLFLQIHNVSLEKKMQRIIIMDYLTYYHKIDTPPFASLSALKDNEAINIMNGLYDANTDDAVWGRFKDPARYLRDRRETECWLKNEFILKGGCPKDGFPIYMIFGSCDLIDKKMASEKLAKIQIPLMNFREEDISFTFFDSMFSFSLGRDKSSEYYQEEYHGKVFMLSEMIQFIKDKELPVDGWWGKIPDDFFPFIEAQIWNHKMLWDIYNEVFEHK